MPPVTYRALRQLMAIKANEAIAKGHRIVLQNEWFEI